MTEKGASTRRLEMSRWKTKESSVSRQAELERRNTQLQVIRETKMPLFVQRFKGKKQKFVLNRGLDRKPVLTTMDRI